MDRLAFAPLSGSTGSHLQEHILYNILVKPSLVLSLSLSLFKASLHQTRLLVKHQLEEQCFPTIRTHLSVATLHEVAMQHCWMQCSHASVDL